MRTIDEYPIRKVLQQTVPLPAGANVLAIVVDGKELKLAAEVETEAGMTNRTLYMVRKGGDMKDVPKDVEHVGYIKEELTNTLTHFFVSVEQFEVFAIPTTPMSNLARHE